MRNGAAHLIATVFAVLLYNFGNRLAAGSADVVPITGSPVLASSASATGGASTLFKSTDGGTTWIPTSLSGVSINSIAVDPMNDLTVYAGTEAGVLKSTDGGVTWNQLGLQGYSINILVMSPQNSCTLYIAISAPSGGSCANYFSTDCGASWHLGVDLVNTCTSSIAATQTPTQEMLFTADKMLCTAIYSQSSVSCKVIGDPIPAGSTETVATAPSNLCWAYVGTSNGYVYTTWIMRRISARAA